MNLPRFIAHLNKDAPGALAQLAEQAKAASNRARRYLALVFAGSWVFIPSFASAWDYVAVFVGMVVLYAFLGWYVLPRTGPESLAKDWSTPLSESCFAEGFPNLQNAHPELSLRTHGNTPRRLYVADYFYALYLVKTAGSEPASV